jgi:hypothetical protein
MDVEIVDDGIYSTATGLSCCAQEGDMSATLVSSHTGTWAIYADKFIIGLYFYLLSIHTSVHRHTCTVWWKASCYDKCKIVTDRSQLY